MRVVALILAGALLSPVPASSQSTPPIELLKPSPAGVVLAVGKWLMEPNKPKIYHIRVQGRGLTDSQARSEGYKLAIEQAIGSLVLSESIVVDQNLQRREIIEYSSGYIDRFKVLNSYSDGRFIVVDMDVWVKHSQIADRLLNKSTSTSKVDGERIGGQVQTLAYERQQGDRVLEAVLNDFPQRAFDIKSRNLETKFSSQRGANISVQIELSMNADYVNSLHEALTRVSQNSNAGECRSNCHHDYTVTMQGRNNRMLFNNWSNTFGFNDLGKPRMMHSKIMASEPAVLLTIRDGGGQAIHKSCHYWAELDGQVRHTYPKNQFFLFKDNYAQINGSFVMIGQIEVFNIASISRANSMDFAVIKGLQCPR